MFSGSEVSVSISPLLERMTREVNIREETEDKQREVIQDIIGRISGKEVGAVPVPPIFLLSPKDNCFCGGNLRIIASRSSRKVNVYTKMSGLREFYSNLDPIMFVYERLGWA